MELLWLGTFSSAAMASTISQDSRIVRPVPEI